MSQWLKENYRLEASTPDGLLEKIKDTLHESKGSPAISAILDMIDIQLLRHHQELVAKDPGSPEAVNVHHEMKSLSWVRYEILEAIAARGREEEERLRNKAEQGAQFFDRQFFDGSSLGGGMPDYDIFGTG